MADTIPIFLTVGFMDHFWEFYVQVKKNQGII